ncbi:hypothetical protein [Prevotella intermedia]|uniref:hypothetical protein n=1 Tax=Prevotella intermedia TaxID=28131 RepID=UPI00397B055F
MVSVNISYGSFGTETNAAKGVGAQRITFLHRKTTPVKAIPRNRQTPTTEFPTMTSEQLTELH